MILSEKDLEDYICENQEEFIKEIKEIYNIKEDIKFVGRQVKIGNDNIADLIYVYKNEEYVEEYDFTSKEKTFIIVELKYRSLDPKDLAQISRYITTLSDKLYTKEFYDKETEVRVIGVLVGFDLNDAMQEIEMFLNQNDCDIRFINIEDKLNYNEPKYIHKEKYIEDINLDERILKELNE